MTANAVEMAAAIGAVASEIARTGIDDTPVLAADTYSSTKGLLRVTVQTRTPESARVIAGVFPGLPDAPRVYGDPAAPLGSYRGTWTGMGFEVDIYGPTGPLDPCPNCHERPGTEPMEGGEKWCATCCSAAQGSHLDDRQEV